MCCVKINFTYTELWFIKFTQSIVCFILLKFYSSKITKILLDNPTEELYILKPKIFNSDVFKLQLSTSAKQLACLSPSLTTELDEQHHSHLQMSTLCQYSDNDILDINEMENNSSRMLLTNRSTVLHTTERIIKLKPKSKLYLGLKFTPCAIGKEEHEGSIVFYSEKVCSMKSHLSSTYIFFFKKIWYSFYFVY